MKKIIISVLIALAVLAFAGAAACTQDQPHEHSWDGGEITVPATCSAKGEKTYRCTGCDETKIEAIEKTEHPHSQDWLKNDDEHWQTATCEHAGERVNVGAHDWGDGEVITQATCLKTGLKKYTCVCGSTKTEILPKTAHTFSEDWTTDGEGHWRVCLTEGCTEKTDDASHNWDSGTVTTPPTCQNEGVKTYTCTDCQKSRTEAVAVTSHDYGTEWSSDGSGHFHACQYVGCTEEVDRAAHSFGDWTYDGRMVKFCGICNYGQDAPEIAPNRGKTSITVGGGEAAGLSLFTMSTGYYTVKCTTTVNVSFKCVYYEWDFDTKQSVEYTKEFSVTPESGNFTLKLKERAVCYITAESESPTPVDISVYTVWDDKAPGHEHSYSDEWSSDENFHWHACTDSDCDDSIDSAEHDGDICSVCGYEKKEAENQ